MLIILGKCKRKWIALIISAIVLILTLLFSYSLYFSSSNYEVFLDGSFIDEVRNSIASSGSIDFDYIADFMWDELIIIEPYTNVQHVISERNLAVGISSSGIEHRDDIALLVFVYQGYLVSYIEYPRYLGDFIDHSFEGIRAFNRYNAMFVVSYEDATLSWSIDDVGRRYRLKHFELR